ncbi:MAG: hypothetical protein EOO88_44655, partial [Pedobacter sp.]
PTLTTTALTNITPTSATGGGTISSDGGEEITATGLVFSNTSNMPTLSDSKTSSTTTSGTFISELIGLTSGKNYYVRAYATNSVGTGYGNVTIFSTGNAGPEAKAIKISGDKSVGALLTGTYAYYDAENNSETGTTFQWYVANDSIGAAQTPITGATAITFTVTDSQKDRFIRLGITAKASAGTSPGIETRSYWLGPIGGEVITFTYNGKSVTYGVITSSATGRKWMDRNLGAQRAATSYDDYRGYGDLFQWGRVADGHQLITWTASSGEGAGTAVNGATVTLSTTDMPVNPLFIIIPGNPLPSDWLSIPNNNLWKAPTYINNPCPVGWHIPTEVEWIAENLQPFWPLGFDQLKLTAGGMRHPGSGKVLASGFVEAGRTGWYWSSEGYSNGYTPSFRITDGDVGAGIKSTQVRANGFSCRCIKNQ